MGVYEQATVGEPVSTGDPKILAQLKGMNELLNGENKLGNTLRWQTATVIATEETRENTAFGKLTTPDEVKEVVLPSNGLIAIGYIARFKQSKASQARAALFLGANQLKVENEVQEAAASSSLEFRRFVTTPVGLSNGTSSAAALNTTGEILGSTASGGLTYVFAAAGTYTVSVQYKALEGSVTAKERKLWVGVVGV